MSGPARSGPYQGQPEHGVRFELICAEGGGAGADAVYRGHAHTAQGSVPVVVQARRAGASAEASCDDAALAQALARAASALVRAATRSELEAGQALPRKIVRWRSLG